MSDNKLQKRGPSSLKEKGQYFLAFGVIASMLLVAGFPVFVVFFFGIFAYFLWKIFSSGPRNDSREIFEFYLAANEILRDDDRRWFGFEVNEVTQRGEHIIQSMNPAPPLVYFTLGALYNKVGNHRAAADNLTHVIENTGSDEAALMHPTQELRNYVRILRKIEREPAETPLTSSAIRALERARRNRGKVLLDESRAKAAAAPAPQPEHSEDRQLAAGSELENRDSEIPVQPESIVNGSRNGSPEPVFITKAEKPRRKRTDDDPFVNRKPITEVLHDIYDNNIQ